MIFSLKIPVTKREFQLLEVMCGKSPFKASYKNAIGKLILSSYNNKNGIKRQYVKNYQGLYYEVLIPYLWVERFGVLFVSDDSVADFIEYLEKEFRLRMFAYIDGKLDFKKQYNHKNKNNPIVVKMKQAALEYLYKNNLSEDFMVFETIKKAYQRYEGQCKTIDILSL